MYSYNYIQLSPEYFVFGRLNMRNAKLFFETLEFQQKQIR